MSIYHCSIKNIGRSGGKSAVASSAYRSGEKLEDLETGLSHDYTKKSGIEYTEIILCENAPREYQDRAMLWNEVQKIEKASDARLAREWEVAIPKELSLEQGQKLVHDFGQSLADEGMCVDIAIHDKGDGNRHAHIMGTTRPIKENGEWGAKEKKAYALDDKGERIPVIDESTGQQKVRARKGKGEEKLWKRVTVETNDWNKSEKVEEWRKRWAEHCNHYLEKEQQIDHRSYERQGKEQIPTIHEGYVARQIEQRGEVSEVCQVNRDIRQYNDLTIEQNFVERLRNKLVKEMKQLYERLSRIKSGRRIDERTGEQASRTGAVDRPDSRSAEQTGTDREQTVRERLASLRSSGASREVEKPSEAEARPESTVQNIGAFLSQLNADERASEEKRDNKIAQRQDRDAERERQRAEAEHRAKAEEQRLAKERAKSKARSRSYDIEL
uniref:MobA/MobL protein domain-containing protein n=1 Tax=uncultured prokaryote TaxID=198431 RepID=A0A0H5Q6J6_9ZZZZ|nr:hypothetical protein [uncultured prokaryote]